MKKTRGRVPVGKLPRGPLKEPELRISAQEVAQREIDTAIHLFLGKGDPVAIHVLSMAAFEVVEAEAKRRGVDTVWEQHVAQLPLEHQDAYRALIKGPFNFMKHGGKKGELLSDFMPGSVHLHLIVAASTYWHVFEVQTPLMPALWGWARAHEPKLVLAPADGGPP